MRTLLAALALLVTSANADERILEYGSRIEVQPDSSLTVTETIRVRAEGDRIRRGIFREFPTVYRDRHGERVAVGFDLLAVHRDGVAEPWHQERRHDGVVTYIGHPDRILPSGEYAYQLVYRSDRQLGHFAEHDELYWNVTGNGWRFPIDRAQAQVILPPGVPPDAVRLEAYTGPAGARGRHFTAQMQAGGAHFATTRTLGPQEGFTIVVMWPKGFVSTPGAGDRLSYLLRDNRPLALAAGGLGVLLLYYLSVWRRVGRDPQAGVVVPRYRPPEGESPASMRYLQRMGYDTRCFAAGVLSVAVKGYLSIEQKAGSWLKGAGFTLTRRRGATTPLAADEHALLRDLFVLGETLEVKDDNHAIVAAAMRDHEKALKAKYGNSHFRINRGWHFAGVFLSLGAAVAPIAAAAHYGYDVAWFLFTGPGLVTVGVVLLGLLLTGVFGRLLKAPTGRGRSALDEIAGFRRYLEVAEGDEIALAQAPRKTPSLFETYLPFALALGVEQRWAEKFAEVFRTQAGVQQPDWYHGDRWDVGDLTRFSSGFGSAFDSAISAASTAPGSSSGGDGGGSSGGGGGGGGGGGW